MNNPQTQTTSDGRHRTKTNKTKRNTTQKTKMKNNRNPTKQQEVNLGTREG